MPFANDFVDGGKGIHRVGIGIVTGPEMLAVIQSESADDERYRRLRYELVDFSATTQMKISLEETRRIVERSRRMGDWAPGIVVAVAAPLDITYGIARMWHSIYDEVDWKRNLFRHRAEALAWIRQQLPSGDDPDQYPSLHQPPVMDAPALR